MKNFRKLISILAMSMLLSFPVEASEINVDRYSYNAQQEETILLPTGTENSRDEINGIERSSIISTASSEIIDETGGDIGVIIETL